METWRRVALLLGVSLAIWLFWYACLDPIVTVSAVDFARLQESETSFTEEGQYLSQLPLEEYIAEKTRERFVRVSGDVWESFFRDVSAASAGEKNDPDWTRRLSHDQTRWQSTPYQVFFRPWEEPLASVAEQLVDRGPETVFLGLEQDGQTQYLRLNYRVLETDDFQLGTGLLQSPAPPASFLYPHRGKALWILLATIVCYFLIPWKKREPDAICYPHWAVALGDLAAMILFIPFLALPILIIGGSVQAITTHAIILTAVLWPFAFAGAWVSLYMAEYGSYQILIREDGLYVETCRRRDLYPFDAMDYWEPLELRPPRWLIMLLWLASLTGRGARSYQAAGQAMMLSGSSSGGFGIRLKNGSAVYLWITAQMGKHAASHFDRLLAALETAGILHREKVRVIESVTIPDGEGEAVSAYSRYRNWTLWAILLSPLVAICGALVCVSIGNMIGKAGRIIQMDGESERTEQPPTPGELTATGVVWEKMIQLQATTMGQSLIETSDGGLLIGAVTWQPGGSQQSVAAIRTNGDGEVLWSKTYGDTRINHVQNVVVTKDGGYLLLGHVANRVGAYAEQQMCIRKIGAEGDLQWERVWSKNEEDSPTARDATEIDNGGVAIWGNSDRAVYRLQLDAAGEVASTQTFDVSEQVGDGEVNWASVTFDGGTVVTGETLNQDGGYKDLLLMKLTPEGDVVWKHAFGGKRRESGNHVRQLASGGFVATGVTHSGEARDQDFYVIRTDSDGNLLWDQIIAKPGDQWAWRVSSTPEDNVLVVGESRPTNESGPSLFFVELGTDGTLIQEQQIVRKNANYTGADAIASTDGNRLVLGSRSLEEFKDEIVLIKLEKESRPQ